MSPPPEEVSSNMKMIMYLSDRGLAVLILIGLYLFADNVGNRWVDAQHSFTNTILESQEMQDKRFHEYIELRKEQVRLDQERLDVTQETLDSLTELLKKSTQTQ